MAEFEAYRDFKDDFTYDPTMMHPLPETLWRHDTLPGSSEEGLPGFRVYAYDDVHKLLTDTDSFGQQFAPDPFAPDTPMNFRALWALDNPIHDAMRQLVGESFHRRVMTEWTPAIEEITDDIVRQITESGENRFEVVSTIGRLPAATISKILDIPLDDHFSKLVQQVGSGTKWAGQGEVKLNEYFDTLIEARRQHPGSGWLDDLIAREGEELSPGVHLTKDAIKGQAYSLAAAGEETTGAGLANMLQVLASPENNYWQELHQDRSLIPGAINEVLRLYPPFPAVPVVAKKEVEFNNVTLAPGTMVVGWVTAANRDPARFPDPHTFDMRRPSNPHLSFARGPHYCLGAPLAQLEMGIMLNHLLDTFPNLAWDTESPAPRTAGLVHGLSEGYCTY